LVKLEKYSEANVIVLKRQQIEKDEQEKFKKENNEKYKKKTESLAKKHLLEENALKTKIENEILQMKKITEN